MNVLLFNFIRCYLFNFRFLLFKKWYVSLFYILCRLTFENKWESPSILYTHKVIILTVLIHACFCLHFFILVEEDILFEKVACKVYWNFFITKELLCLETYIMSQWFGFVNLQQSALFRVYPRTGICNFYEVTRDSHIYLSTFNLAIVEIR